MIDWADLTRQAAQLSPDRRAVLLADMGLDEARQWLTHIDPTPLTPFTPLPHQIPPAQWSAWVLAGGRGIGKTVTLARTVAHLARTTPGLRGRIISPTLSDAVNGVVLDQQSGILAHDPTAQFKPSGLKGPRVEWPNGATVWCIGTPTLRDVDRLRALTNIDCIAEGIPVATSRGDVRIEDVRPGDMVLTRRGYRRVLAWAYKGERPTHELVTTVGSLRGTTDHRVWDAGRQRWSQLGVLKQGDMLDACRPSMERPTTESSLATTRTHVAHSCTEPSGMQLTALSPLVTRSTTKTATGGTTPWTIWYSCHLQSITRCISVKRTQTQSTNHDESPLSMSSGSNAPQSRRHVLSAGSASSTAISLLTVSGFVRRDASSATGRDARKARNGRTPHASSAGKSSELGSTQLLAPPHGHALARVLRSSATGLVERVYDLTVEGEPEFYAGGVLVHNCDAFDEAAANPQLSAVVEQAALSRRGAHLPGGPRWIAATTPRPVPAYKAWMEDETVTVTRASTHDNPHTPDEYRAYAESLKGTRLYRQEILGEVVDDVEGALWTLADLERSTYTGDRQQLIDSLGKVVVGVDPPSGSGTCGIVVVGKSDDGHLYVLDDYSITDATPHQWALRVAAASADYGATVVAEINQGGRMVTEVLRQSAPGLAVTTVRATVGKKTRAEPVSALWEAEHQTAHLAGESPDTLTKLTVELTEWVEKEAPSPDRLDAMVHACTHLMTKGTGTLYAPSTTRASGGVPGFRGIRM